jgi:hypothetical protein
VEESCQPHQHAVCAYLSLSKDHILIIFNSTGWRPYKCKSKVEGCEAEFATGGGLTRHWKDQHPEVKRGKSERIPEETSKLFANILPVKPVLSRATRVNSTKQKVLDAPLAEWPAGVPHTPPAGKTSFVLTLVSFADLFAVALYTVPEEDRDEAEEDDCGEDEDYENENENENEADSSSSLSLEPVSGESAMSEADSMSIAETFAQRDPSEDGEYPIRTG